ncbi:hypothetical protein JCM8097_008106 [Rhodosporidiobolus ruineniae]
MLASLAGGASCGPSNPLQQLSKTYGQDRGVAQDHFGAAGPSGAANAFRQQPSSSSSAQLPTDPSAQHFFQPQAGPSSQAFDLSPLNRALTPAGQSASPAPPPPAWATAFQAQQHQPGQAASAQEQELFARAFGGRPVQQQQHNWHGEFQSAHPVQQQQQPHAAQHHATPLPAQASRLYSQGFGGATSMMQARQMAFQQGPVVQEGRVEGEAAQKGRQDWEQAFLAQESVSSSTSTAETAASSSFAHITETRPLTPPLRSHSPLADPVARDALAQTAANLLSTVETAESQRQRDGPSVSELAAEPIVDVGNKFANSSFMSLMRQLRDGQVAVEGDKMVEQSQPFASTSAAKGKARANDWASDFASSLQREEEGRVNAAATATAPPVLRPGEPVEQFAGRQHAWAERQANSAQIVRELQEGYRTLEGLWDEEDQARAARERSRDKGKGKGKERELQFQGDGGGVMDEDDIVADTHVPLAQSGWEEDLDDPAFISGGHAPGLATRQYPHAAGQSAQQREWDALQQSWDDFEVTAAGIRPKNQDAAMRASAGAPGYAFAQNNPYLQTTHHHAHHAFAASSSALAADGGAVSAALLDRHDSLLQHEANVQRDPSSAGAWLALGLKQQQNEREDLAIAALKRAVELFAADVDGSTAAEAGAAHLGLAVSYTNEGRRFEAYEEIDRWVSALGRSTEATPTSRAYANEIDQYRNLFGAQLPTTSRERLEYLSGLLIRLAQSHAEVGGGHGVDADVQIALGVLFNSSEDYIKASDCFEAALSVRPHDPLLFNRLGATHANSGNTQLAMQYYLAALDLDPGYVRARFNLAVANMNLGQYEDSVQHLLTALSIQETDAEQAHIEQAPVAEPNGHNGITSNTLWDSLKVSLLQMHRSDLAALAQQRDLHGLMQALPPTA